MSDAAWMNTAEDTSVGSATIEADDELFTIVGHGLTVGERVVVTNLSGGAVGVLGDGGVYWVTSVPDADTFSISLTKEGISIVFSSDGGADVDLYQPTYAAAELRRLDASLMFGGVSDAFGARQGVRPGHVPLTVSGTTWTVEDLTGVVYPGQSSADGPYRVAHQEESGSLDPADGTNDRIDALDLQIQDHDIDASGFRRARVVYVDGAPAADPDPPTVTANSLRLGTILVPSGGSPSPSIVTLAQWTVASGGVVPVRTDSEGPGAGRYEGMMRYRQDDDVMEVWDGSTWTAIARPNAPAAGWTPIANGSHSGGSFQIDVTDGGRFPAGTFRLLRLHLYGDLDGEGTVRLHINGPETGSEHQSGMIVHDASTGFLNEVHAAGSSHWYVANWATVTGCVATILLLPTDASDAVAFIGHGGRPSPTASAMIESKSWGRLTANHLVDTLEVRSLSDQSNQFAECIWTLEGYRA